MAHHRETQVFVGPTPAEQEKHAARMVCALMDAVIEAVAEGGMLGAPGGVLYAGLMTAGVTFDQYEMLMHGMVHAQLLKQHGHLFTITEKGRQWIAGRRSQGHHS
jgi:hypothetical protein